MASPSDFIFGVYSPTGAPLTGAAGSLSFAAYKDDLGNNLSQPAFAEIGGGLYKFTPTFVAGRAICYIVATSSNVPPRFAGALRPEDYSAYQASPSPQIIVFAIYDPSTGLPKTGVTCSFSSYKDNLGNNLSQPSIVEIGGGLYKFAPVFGGNYEISYVLNTAGNNPLNFSGFTRAEDFTQTGFIATSAVATTNQIIVSFASGYTLDALGANALNPANWVISGAPSFTVTGVSLVANQVVLTTTGQGNGNAYTVTLPTSGVTANGGSFGLLGPVALAFTGVAGDPALLLARDFDERKVDVFFVFAPVAARALDPTQYSISPSLAVVSVQQVTSVQYRLTTGPQTTGQVYTLTWPTH